MNAYTVASALHTLSPSNPPPIASFSFSTAGCIISINNTPCWVRFTTRNKRRGLLLKRGCGRAPDLLPPECNWEEDYEDHEFIVVNFYHFVSIEDPDEEVSKHLSFLQVENHCPQLFLPVLYFLECFSVYLISTLRAVNSTATLFFYWG